MKTNKLPKSEWNDFEAAGSHLQQYSQPSQLLSTDYMTYNNEEQAIFASNDASYESELFEAMAAVIANANNNRNHTTVSGAPYVEQPINVDGGYKKAACSHSNDSSTSDSSIDCTIQFIDMREPVDADGLYKIDKSVDEHRTDTLLDSRAKSATIKQNPKVSERVFMSSLIKHTGIALAIIIPLAAFSAYAAPVHTPVMLNSAAAAADKVSMTTENIEPSDIIYKSATAPTTVDRVDLQQYAGTWYEIGRLPLYFQRNCASDVTANYAARENDSGITVTNRCIEDNGEVMVSKGLAKPSDNTGSKLKVSFLPSWIRWLPVGRGDYWILARDADYQTALVGTPDKDNLWLLARTPNISQQTYAKYRQIAQEQGYDLREFTLTTQSDQTVNLVP